MVRCYLLHFTFLRYFPLFLLLNIQEKSIAPKGHFCLVGLLSFSTDNYRVSPAPQVIINIKGWCAIPALNTFKTGNEIDPITSFTATGITIVLPGDCIEVISKLL